MLSFIVVKHKVNRFNLLHIHSFTIKMSFFKPKTLKNIRKPLTSIEDEPVETEIKRSEQQPSALTIPKSNSVKSEKIEKREFSYVNRGTSGTVFIPSSLIEEAKDEEELEELLGKKRSESEKLKDMKKKELVDKERELYRLPDKLKPKTPSEIESYQDTLVKLASTGIIEIPLTLEEKVKKIEETEVAKNALLDDILKEELDYINMLKRSGFSYQNGFKSDLGDKKRENLAKKFGFVFEKSKRKKKFAEQKEKDSLSRIEKF